MYAGSLSKRVFAVLATAAWLAVACGSPPTIKSQQAFQPQATRPTQFIFVYQEAELTAKTIYGPGGGEMILGDTGFYQFGELVAKRSAAVLAKHGITIVHSMVVPLGNERAAALKSLSDVRRGRAGSASLLSVTPRGGTATGGRAASNAQIEFDVRLFDPDTSKPIWNAVIDTRTWKGKDLFNKNFQGNRFDEAYADQFLELIAKSLEGARAKQ